MFWAARLGYLGETCRLLVTYRAVDRVILVWNNRDLPVPPCLRPPVGSGQPRSRVVVVRPPAAAEGR